MKTTNLIFKVTLGALCAILTQSCYAMEYLNVPGAVNSAIPSKLIKVTPKKSTFCPIPPLDTPAQEKTPSPLNSSRNSAHRSASPSERNVHRATPSIELEMIETTHMRSQSATDDNIMPRKLRPSPIQHQRDSVSPVSFQKKEKNHRRSKSLTVKNSPIG